MTLHAYTDGASRGNPGESGIGILVKNEQGEVMLSAGGYIGQATNNLAEYTALLTLLKHMKRIPCTTLLVHSDSELMVKQFNGEYKIRNRDIAVLHGKIMALLAASPFEMKLRHIPRDRNSEADRLANLGIESKKRIRA
jgi:ribonuclease HI